MSSLVLSPGLTTRIFLPRRKFFPTVHIRFVQEGTTADFVNHWFLMGTPLAPGLILAMYLMFVLKLGRYYMKHREPYHFPRLIIVYNVIQAFLSVFLIYACGRMLIINGLIPKTCAMETEFNRQGITSAMYYYLLAKISELLDTVFFVLRKKERQMSFLHVYHHTLMVVVTWTALKYEPTIHLLVLGVVNSFIHVIMYIYYGLSAFPNMAKYLWWKKYITSLQLMQFVVVMSIFVRAAFTSDCTPSYVLFIALSTNGFLFLYLFGKFYLTNYTKRYSKSPGDTTINGKSYNAVKTMSNGYGKEISQNDRDVPNYRDSNENKASGSNFKVEFTNKMNIKNIKLTKMLKQT